MQRLQESRENETLGNRLLTTKEAILGIYLKDPALFRETRNKVKTEMFGELKWLFETMVKLDSQDALTFKSIAIQHHQEAMQLHRLRNECGSTNAIRDLIEQLKQEQLQKGLHDLLYKTYAAMKTEEPGEVLSELTRDIQNLSITEGSDLHDPEQDVEEWYQWLQEIMADPSKAFGMMTGLDELDRITTGFQRTDFIVVGARTSMGKSAFMLEMILRLTRNGHKCAIFSLEMSKRQIYNRFMSNLLGASLEVLRTGQLAKERLNEVAEHRKLLKRIYVDDTRGVSADHIVDQIRRLKRTQGLDFVVVDYIQDVKEKGETNDNGGSAIGRVCRKLRSGAQECDVAVMGLSQVTRGVEDRQDKRPTVSDLAGSTGIETSADVIAMLYRDDYYNPNTQVKDIMEINFAKQRNGQLGKVELFYAKHCQRLLPLNARR